jgi:hypothetical protein
MDILAADMVAIEEEEEILVEETLTEEEGIGEVEIMVQEEIIVVARTLVDQTNTVQRQKEITIILYLWVISHLDVLQTMLKRYLKVT